MRFGSVAKEGWHIHLISEYTDVDVKVGDSAKQTIPTLTRFSLIITHHEATVLELKDAKALTIRGDELNLLMKLLDELEKQEDCSHS